MPESTCLGATAHFAMARRRGAPRPRPWRKGEFPDPPQIATNGVEDDPELRRQLASQRRPHNLPPRRRTPGRLRYAVVSSTMASVADRAWANKSGPDNQILLAISRLRYACQPGKPPIQYGVGFYVESACVTITSASWAAQPWTRIFYAKRSLRQNSISPMGSA